MLLESLLALSLVLPGLLVLRLARLKITDPVEILSFSYLLSLALFFALLYVGGITDTFVLMSSVLFIVVILSVVYVLLLFASRLHTLRLSAVSKLVNSLRTGIVVPLSIVSLLVVYAAVLASRALFDSDVAQLYLPLAREIVSTNGFTYGTGYDYAIFLKPIGVSVLYAWVYATSGSTLSESFRLMPLVPIFLLVILNYRISTSVTKSQIVGLLSSVVFVFLPFQDRLLFYGAFYPDTFFYPLIFMVIYLLTKYYQTRDNRLLFWAGLSLGVASLLKAQSIYFLMAFLIVVVVLEVKSKPLSFVLCFLAPLLILIPSVLAVSIQQQGLDILLPTMTYDQLALLLLASTLSGVCYLAVSHNTDVSNNPASNLVKILGKKIILSLIPFCIFFGLWYANNLLRFGTIIYTSSINLPNYDWALGLLKSIQTPTSPADFWHYFAYFMFIFVHPAVMGYVMLVPFLTGLFVVFKRMPESFRIFLLFEVISASIIISNVVISIPSGVLGYNPRDILPLAPLLATLPAVGIAHVTKRLYRSSNKKFVYLSLVMVAYFGFLNYAHSVIVWYSSLHNPNILGRLMSGFAGLAGLNLEETSYQLAYASGVVFVVENLLNIVLLSVLAGMPFLVLVALSRLNLASRLTTRVKHSNQGNLVSKSSSTRSKFAKNLLVISLIVAVIIVPRVGVSGGEIDPQGMKEGQLQAYYGDIYKLFDMRFQGDILTFNSPQGLPYYLHGIKIVDLVYAANLAFLKDCFQYNSSTEAAAKLKLYGIRYMLISINSSDTQQLDARLNFTLSRIILDPSVSNLSGVFGLWGLYDLI